MRRRWTTLALVLGSLATAPAQVSPIGTWESYTDLANVRAVESLGPDAMAAAGSGGVFVFHPSTGRFDMSTNASGLSSNDLTAVARDDAGGLWVGASDGSVNHRPAGSSSWRSIDDIRQSNRMLKGIRRFVPTQFFTLIFPGTANTSRP